MTLKTLLCVSGLASALCASSSAFAQPSGQSDSDTPPASETPARPVLIPMTPGATVPPAPDRPAKPPRARARIVTAPGTGTEPDARRDSDYQFCNKTSYEIQVAIGIRQSTGFWATRGWWPVPAGECKAVIKGKLTQPTFYTFAKSSFAHTGPTRMWGGNQTLCIGKTQFQATSDGTEQCGPGLEAQGFAKIDTGGKPSWITYLSESPGYKTNEQARIAGLQRLLNDLGRYQGGIDGVETPKFSEALAQARDSYNIPVSDNVATIYSKLHAEAMKVQLAVGLTYCNRTQEVVWTALARETQGKKVSKGWWKLQAGQCEKVIRDPLIERFVYVFAEQTGEGAAQPWKGPINFCTRDQVFEIEGAEDCEGRGFANTGFRQIDTGGKPGVIYEFHREESAPAPAEP